MVEHLGERFYVQELVASIVRSDLAPNASAIIEEANDCPIRFGIVVASKAADGANRFRNAPIWPISVGSE